MSEDNIRFGMDWIFEFDYHNLQKENWVKEEG